MPLLQKVGKQRLTEFVTVSVGAVTRVIATAGEQIPWQQRDYDTVGFPFCRKNRPHTIDSFF
jgi:hypothetical protein